MKKVIARAISGRLLAAAMNAFTFRSKVFTSSLLSRCCNSKVNPPVAPSPGMAGGAMTRMLASLMAANFACI